MEKKLFGAFSWAQVLSKDMFLTKWRKISFSNFKRLVLGSIRVNWQQELSTRRKSSVETSIFPGRYTENAPVLLKSNESWYNYCWYVTKVEVISFKFGKIYLSVEYWIWIMMRLIIMKASNLLPLAAFIETDPVINDFCTNSPQHNIVSPTVHICVNKPVTLNIKFKFTFNYWIANQIQQVVYRVNWMRVPTFSVLFPLPIFISD